MNKAIIIGNLGADPELKELDGDNAVCKLRVASSRKYTKKDGEKVEDVEWHRVTVWGKLANLCGQYLSKGRQVAVEGRLQTSQYEKEGVTHYSTEIVASSIQFLGGKGGATSEDRDATKASNPKDDDIPF